MRDTGTCCGSRYARVWQLLILAWKEALARQGRDRFDPDMGGTNMALDEAGLPLEVRFWRRVQKTDSCWLWKGHMAGGYGRIRLPNGPRVQAHRLAFEMLTGQVIPSGMFLDHLRRNQRCVNPAHLEAVTSAENTRRGAAPSAVAMETGWCVSGAHRLEGDNLRVRPNGKRECRACALAAQRRHRARNRDRINARKREVYAAIKGGV